MERTEEVSLLDSSLTSLSWLQNLRVHDLIFANCSLSPDKYISTSPHRRDGCKSSRANYGVSLSPIKKCLLQSADFRAHPKKYSTTAEKPPFSYSTLLYLAIQQSKAGKVTLNEIYHWIRETFQYYRCAEAGWQNSIRHNLSLNELFCKLPRSHGKGNYWRINPDYHDLLEDNKEHLLLNHQRRNSCSKLRSSKLKGNCGRKRAHSQSESSFSSKSIRSMKRRRIEGTADLSGVAGDLDWISLLGSQRMNSTYKPVFSSPDLPQVADTTLSSPLVFPVTTAAVPVEIPATPSMVESYGALLEEAVLKQESPSPQVLLPWAENNSQSPRSANLHPWAESKESTMHGLKNLSKTSKPAGVTESVTFMTPIWSPDQSWSSSSTNSLSSASFSSRTLMLSRIS